MSAADYIFVDEWNVDAPIDAVFDALADTRTYPEWWTPTYLSVTADGPPAVGTVSAQHFRGALPYTLKTTSRISRLDAPYQLGVEVEGDLRGTGLWTLSRRLDGGVHVRFAWRVHADRPLLRFLSPFLRPLFRWNHNVAINRAMVGLGPHARRQASFRAVSYTRR